MMRCYPVAVELTDQAATVECVCGWVIRVEHTPGCTCGAPDLLELAIAAGEAHERIERLRRQYSQAMN